jgi:hypothetical protein
MIRDRLGLPLVCKRFHKPNVYIMIALGLSSTSFPSESRVVVFNESIGREDPPVKGASWAEILFLYREGNTET